MLRYLSGSKHLGVMFGGKKAVQGYIVADWVGDTDGSLSITGFVITFNGVSIWCASKRQATEAMSTAEAKTVAFAMDKQALWLRKLLWR